MVAIARYTLIVMLALTSLARAETPTGLVVIGDAKLHKPAYDALARWLADHGHAVEADPLDKDGVLTIANCVNIHDLACARAVVEKRAKSDSVVFAQVAATREQAVAIDVLWMVKGHEALSEHRACEDCSELAMQGTLAEIMNVLAPSTGTSARIKIASKPPGATVVIDHEVVGVAPVARDLAPGRHEIVLMKGTHEVGRRTVNVHPTEIAEVTIQVHDVVEPPPRPIVERHSRVPGAIVLGVGIAAVATGAVLYATSQTDDGTRYQYLDTRPAGIVTGVAGLATAAIGFILLQHAIASDAAPIAAIGPHGGFIGWARAF